MSDRETISATLNSIESSVGANELSAYQVFTRMKRLVQAAQAQAGDGSPYGYVSEHTNGMAYFHTNIVEIYRDTALSITPVYTAPSAVPVNQQLLEALQHIMKMQTFGYIVLGEEATTKARTAIAAAQQRHGAEGRSDDLD